MERCPCFHIYEIEGVEVGEDARSKVMAIEMDVCSHVLKLVGNKVLTPTNLDAGAATMEGFDLLAKLHLEFAILS